MQKLFENKNKLYCFYDFQICPASYDFFTFLYSAEISRMRRGLKEIELVLIQGPVEKFRGDWIRSTIVNENFFNNVILPGICILPSVTSFYWISKNELDIETVPNGQRFPRGYRLSSPIDEYRAHELVAAKIRGDRPSFFSAPEYAKTVVDNFIKQTIGGAPFVTVTAREIDRFNVNSTRNFDKKLWKNIFQEIKNIGVTPILIRDTKNAFDQPVFKDIVEANIASVHLPCRVALYEKAVLNFSRINGPASLLLFGKGHSMIFAKFDDDSTPVSRKWFSEHFGMDSGSQFPMTTTRTDYVWEPESAALIVDRIKRRLENPMMEEKLHDFSNSENVKFSFQTALKHFIKCSSRDLMAEDAKLLERLNMLNNDFGFFQNFEEKITNWEGKNIPQGTIKLLKKQFNLTLQ